MKRLPSNAHTIVATIDAGNAGDFDSPQFRSADVAIEFTAPSEAMANYRRAWAAGVPVVSGTTGWTASLPTLADEIRQNGYTLFWSSNFSLGVNILFEINRRLATIMNRYPAYSPALTEIHHTAKKDAPSGAAITLANEAIDRLDSLAEWQLVDNATAPDKAGVLPIEAIRQGSVPGIHEMAYTSAVDRISIRHEAFSRDGFALGAVMAAEYIVGNNATGLLSMHDMLKF